MNAKILGITAVFLILVGSVFAFQGFQSQTQAQETNDEAFNHSLLSQ